MRKAEPAKAKRGHVFVVFPDTAGQWCARLEYRPGGKAKPKILTTARGYNSKAIATRAAKAFQKHGAKASIESLPKSQTR